MNVCRQSERSWRKARKRAVSPIIATILLVAITVVLAAVLYVLISGLTHGPGNTPLGSAFTPGTAVLNKASATGGGCTSAHYCYTLTIASSTVTLGSVQFEVKTAAGGTFGIAGTGAFSIVDVTNTVVADQSVTTVAAMTSGFSTFPTGDSTSTPLTTLFTIVVDLGTGATSPAGTGLTFVALGIGSYSGSTSVALP